MKRILLLFVIAVLPFIGLAQAPQALNYQAVARSTTGAVLVNQTINVRLSINNITAAGTTVYQETHTGIATNQFGLFTLKIGTGTPNIGTFPAVDWANGAKFLKVEADLNNSGTYVDMGTSQFISVPYALVAGSAANATDNQTLSITGNSLSISGGNSVTLPSGGADNWGTQTAVTNNTLMGNGTAASPLGIAQQSATSGQVMQWNGSAWAPATISGGVGDNWGTQSVLTNGTLSGTGVSGNLLGIAQQGATNGQVLKWNGTMWSPANDANTDAQTLSISGNQLSISNGNAVTIPTGTDAQTLSLSGNSLSISNGNSVTLPTGTTYTAGSGISVTGNTITNTGDLSNTNEIQSLSLSGNTLSLSQGGGSVTLPTGTTYTAGSGISISGNTISATDNSSTNEIQTLTLSGSTLSLSQGGGSVTLPSGGSFTLPYVNTVNSASTLFDITNSGAGAAGRFTISGTTSTADALTGYTSGTGSGVFGYNNNGNIANTVWGVFGAYNGGSYGAGVTGLGFGGITNPANTDIGVYGSSSNVGVYGASSGLNGVLGVSTATTGVGVYGNYAGTSDLNSAVYGYNANTTGTQNIGVQGLYNTTSTGYGAGVVGLGYNGSGAVTSADYGVYGSATYGVYGYAPVGGYAVYSEGDFVTTGAKSASVGTSKGNQLVYCMESPEVWFEDFGHTALVNGSMTITLDPLFLETVVIDDAHPMIVTVTPEGDCKGLYAIPGQTSFTVKELSNGTSNVSFSYRITCKRRNYQDHRFGSDVTTGGGDTRTKYHYIAPKPVDYNEAMKTAPQGKHKAETARPAVEPRTVSGSFKNK